MTDLERDELIVALCKGFDQLCDRLRIARWSPPGERMGELLKLVDQLKGLVPEGEACFLLRRIKDLAFDIAQSEQDEISQAALAANESQINASLGVINALVMTMGSRKCTDSGR